MVLMNESPRGPWMMELDENPGWFQKTWYARPGLSSQRHWIKYRLHTVLEQRCCLCSQDLIITLRYSTSSVYNVIRRNQVLEYADSIIFKG